MVVKTTNNKLEKSYEFITGSLYMVNNMMLVYYKSLDTNTHVFFLTRGEITVEDKNKLYTKLTIDSELNQYVYVISDIIILNNDDIYMVVRLPTEEKLSKDILDLLYTSV